MANKKPSEKTRRLGKKQQPRSLVFKPESRRDTHRFQESINKMHEDAEKNETEENRLPGPKTELLPNKSCICGGQIVKHTHYFKKFNSLHGPMIIGPGSQKQFRTVEKEEFYCESCKLAYHRSIVE